MTGRRGDAEKAVGQASDVKMPREVRCEAENGGRLKMGGEVEDIANRACRGLGVLGVREVLGRAIGIFGLIGLSWLLAPNEMAFLSVVSGILGVGGVFTDLGLSALFLQRRTAPTEEDYETLSSIQLMLGFTLCLVLCAFCVFFGRQLRLSWWDGWLIGFAGLSLPINALGGAARVQAERKLIYKPIAAAELFQQVANYVITLSFAASGFAKAGICLGIVVAATAGTAMILLSSRTLPRFCTSMSKMVGVMRSGFGYQLITMLHTLRNGATPALLAWMTGTAVTGQWGWIQRVMVIQNNLLGIVARVSFSAISRLPDESALQRRAAERIVEIVGFVTCAVSGLVIGVGSPLLDLLFSRQWKPAHASLYALLATLSVTGPISVGMGSVLLAQGKQIQGAIFQTVQTAIVWCLGLPLAVKWGLPGIAIGSIVALIVDAILIHHFCEADSRLRLWPLLGPSLLMEMVIIMGLRILRGSGMDSLYGTIPGGLAIVIGAAFLWRREPARRLMALGRRALGLASD